MNFTIDITVFIKKMLTQNMLRKCGGNQVFSEINFRFVTAVDLNKCLQQIKYSISLHACATTSELPPNISTRHQTEKSLMGEHVFVWELSQDPGSHATYIKW